jgi:dUTP pyrophosphatase
MEVKFKKLHEKAVIPSYAKPGDAGLDLTATSQIEDNAYQVSYGTGLAVEIPEGYVGLIYPRSSIRNKEITLSNSVGVIDSGYRGEIQFTFNKRNGFYNLKYDIGDRIGQLVIVPYPTIIPVESEELSNTERGEGGFGSSGK